MTSSISILLFQLLCCFTVLLTLPLLSHASDPDPLQDICVADLKSPISVNGFPCKPAAKVVANDFFFDLSKEPSSFDIFKRAITPGDVNNFPAVNTQGVTLTRIDLGVGGINTPHTHPRATEAGLVLKGKVLVGFVTTNNTFYSKILTPGVVFLIPRGLVHFQLNVGKENVTFLAIFNSQNPGVSDSTATLFSTKPPIPNEVLTKTLLVGDDIINVIRAAQPSNQQSSQFGTWSIY